MTGVLLRMRRALLVVPVLLLAAATATAEPASPPAGLDRLMDLMGTREVIVKTLELSRDDQRLNSVPPAVHDCLLGYLNEGALLEEARNGYLEVFKTPQQVEEAIVFLESPPGQKLVSSILASIQARGSLTDATKPTLPQFSADEIRYLEKFAISEGGKAFSASPSILAAQREEYMRRVEDSCMAEPEK